MSVLQGLSVIQTVGHEPCKASATPLNKNYGFGEKLNEKCIWQKIMAEVLKQILKQILLDREAQWTLLNKRTA